MTGYTSRGTPRISIAPMMDWTDRHYRYFARKLSRRVMFYTEMVTTGAILYGDRDRFLAFHEAERPLTLQIGGDEPDAVARAIEIAEPYGYDEYNLNVGCPSDKVQEGQFGACLMATPEKVARIVRAMRGVTDRPVSVKHRIGIDNLDRYEDMRRFVDIVATEGVERFTVHARIAILDGLTPKQNRTIPPIRYEDVYRLKDERPDLEISVNGQVREVEDIETHLRRADAVMIGRKAYEQPWFLTALDARFFGDDPFRMTRHDVVESLFPYMDNLDAEGIPPRRMINHLLGIFAGQPGARKWKQALSGRLPAIPGREILKRALDAVEDVRSDVA